MEKTVIFEGRKHRVFALHTKYGDHDVICVKRNYTFGDGLAVEMLMVEDGEVSEPWGVLTVNIDYFPGGNRAFVDTNNMGVEICKGFIEKHGLGKFTGAMGRSGYCMYPLYEFDPSKFTVD